MTCGLSLTVRGNEVAAAAAEVCELRIEET